jgi:uncharacterized protein YlxP (DUF503 family)
VFIGVARFEIFIPEATSLKDKRGVLRRILSVVTKKYNVSIAEVDYQDLWQRSALGISCVSGTMGQCRKILQEVEKAVGRNAVDGAEIVDRSIEVFALEDLT